MSTWSCEDFDRIVTQEFTIPTLTFLSSFNFKVIKIGTLADGSTFKVRILDGESELLSEIFTGADINAGLAGNNRGDVSVDCANILLTPSLDGSAHAYTMEWSATGYTSSASSQLTLARREFGDEALTITGLPIDFPNDELANAYPIFIEFFSFKG